MVLDGKSSEQYPANAEVPQGSLLGHTLLGLYVNDLFDDAICNIAIYAGFYQSTSVYSRFSPKIQFL